MDRNPARGPELPELRSREATFVAGVWLTFVVTAAGVGYLVLTWRHPHRLALLVLFCLGFLFGLVLGLMPRKRIVRSPLCEVFFLSWTFLDFALIVLATVIDGGTSSPLLLFLVVPVVFAATTYPVGSVLIVGAVAVSGYLILAVAVGGSGWGQRTVYAVVLACTAAMSAWQAQSQNRQRQALHDIARSDPLTGCLNRRGFEERAAAEIKDSVRRGRQGAILVLDLDHFKTVNDQHGHAAGDELLRWVVHTLKGLIRPTDLVGRLGGDEFAVLYTNIAPQDADNSSMRLSRALKERAASSVGVASYPLDGTQFEALMNTADLRLYATRRAVREPQQALAPA
jgi:diguanylate cyclase (GGDEF)-like protein